MFNSLRLRRKFVAILSLFSLTLNILQPVLLAFTFATPAYAQAVPDESPSPEPTPSVEPSPSTDPTPSPESTPAPTISPEPSESIAPTPSSTPDLSPSPSATVIPSATPVESVSPSPSSDTPVNPEPSSDSSPAPPTEQPQISEPSASRTIPSEEIFTVEQIALSPEQAIITSTVADWDVNEVEGTATTKEPVKLGVKYLFPLVESVTVTFTSLPVDESLRTPLTIKKVKVSDLSLPEDINPYGEYAYDITTGMNDGDFKYDVSLPKPTDKNADVVYMEEVNSTPTTISSDQTTQSGDQVQATNLDHFTIFIATYSSNTFTVSKTTYTQGETVYVKAGDLNTSKYYRMRINPPSGSDIFIASCFNPSSGNTEFTGTYILPANATVSSNWSAELREYDLPDCGDNNIDQPDEASFAVVANSSDLTITKTNDTNNNTTLNTLFNWVLTVTNSGTATATFGNNNTIITDQLPTSGATYGSPTTVYATGVTGAMTCSISSNTLSCTSNNGNNLSIPATKTVTVTIPVTPTAVGQLSNPRSQGTCSVDPNNNVAESNNSNNSCSTNTVTIAQNIVANPNLNATCGIDIGLVIDTSTSIDDGELSTMKSALNTFVSAFTGTPTQMAVVSFDDSAVVQSGFTSNLASLTSVINGISGSGYTNWEDAIHDTRVLFPNRLDKPDLIVFTTDGDPTASSAGGNDSNQPNIHLAPAISEANLAKSAGIRMVTLGIGMTSGDSQTRLQQISSADAFYNSADFSTLQSTLQDLVTDLCGSTVSVTKLIDADGKLNTTNDRTPASGWTFNIGGQAGQVTDGNGQTPAVTLVPGTGYLVSETPQAGYELLSASCTGATKNGYVSGDGIDGIQVGANDIATCTFINSPIQTIDICHAHDSQSNPYNLEHPNRSGDVSGHDDHNGVVWYPGIADHSWGDIIPPFDYIGGHYDGQNWTTEGQAIYNNGCNIPNGTITVTKYLSPTNDSGLFNLTIAGTSYANNVGNGGTTGSQSVNPGTYTVGETAGTATDLANYKATYGGDCNSDGQVMVGVGQDTSCTITNTRKTGSITFLKEVLGGDAKSTDWEFDVLNVGTFANGTFVFNTGVYTVTEVSQQLGYTLTSVDGSVCTAMNVQNGSATLNVTANGGTCKFTNTRDTGSVKVNKLLDNDGNGTYETTNPASFTWSLDSVGTNVMGSTVGSVETTLPNVIHSVNENSPTGYHFVGWYPTTNTQYSCANPLGKTLPVTVNVTKDTTTEITLCNQKDVGSITIIKDVPGTNNQDFAFTGTLGAFTLDNDGNNSNTYKDNKVFSGQAVGSYTVTETGVPTWQLDSLICTGDPNYDVDGTSVTIDLDNGENVVCTFVNRQPKGTVTIIKNAINSSNDNFSFHTNLPGVSNGYFELEDDGNDHNGGTEESITLNVPVGTYYASEDGENGWKLTGLNCDSEGQWGVREDKKSVSFDVLDGETTTCTFENTKLGKIEGVKFNDRDADGHKDNGEKGIKDWEITLGDDEDSTKTDHNGEYDFNHLLPGEYQVCEEDREGWYHVGDLCQTVDLSAGETEHVNFGNYQKAHVTVKKDVVDANGNDIYDDSTGFDFQLTGDDYSSNLNDIYDEDQGQTLDLNPGNYNLDETKDENYTFDGCKIAKHDDENDEDEDNNDNYDNNEQYISRFVRPPSHDFHFNVKGGDEITIICKNKQKTGDLEVIKYNDLNGNGYQDPGEPGEPTLGGWEINLNNNDEFSQSEVTDQETGLASFHDLINGWYSLSETSQKGWTQTNITCSSDERDDVSSLNNLNLLEIVSNDETPKPENPSHDVLINAGQTTTCKVGNQADPILTIEKSNDATGAQSPGSDVVYTIKVELSGSNVNDVFMTDTTPTGFTYRLGSWTANSSVRGDISGLGEPTYNSPGTWTIGDMVVGEVVTLTYTADIAGSVDAGTYKDIAWAYGANSFDESEVLAQGQNSQFVEGIFVGTDVEITKSQQQTGSVNIEKTGEVLGASTELPATGASSIWLILAVALLLLGSILIFGGKLMSKLFVALFVGLSIFSVAPSALASSDLSVRMETPLSPTRSTDWTLAFSALDRSNSSLTLKCYVKKTSGDFVQFDGDKVLPHGGAGSCQVNDSVLNAQGTYSFKVSASNGSDTVESQTSIVVYDTEGPGAPTNYSKDHPSQCRWVIRFKTAGDAGLTTKVEIYSSTDLSFNTNDSTRVGTVSIGSNADGEFIHDRGSDCDKTWYYVIRAFDSIGNQSAHVGDQVNSSVVVSPTSSSTPALTVENANLGALQADDQGDVLGDEQVDTPVEETTGLVQGAKEVASRTIKSKSFWWILSTLVALGLIYGIIRKNQKN